MATLKNNKSRLVWTQPVIGPGSILAQNACHTCSSQKRKCDRRLPGCGRCTKANYACVYHQKIQSPTNTDAELHYGTEKIDEMDGSRDHAKDLWTASPKEEDLDRLVSAEAWSMLRRVNVDVNVVVGEYLRTVHKWLPILLPVELTRCINDLKKRPHAEDAVLLLHIVLATHTLSPATSSPPTQNPLYETCRSLFTQLQLTRAHSLRTLQSGILLSLYELGAGLTIAAYLTVATCASLSYAMHLQGALAYPTSEERIRTWWAVFTMDRLICLASPGLSRPLAVRQPPKGAAIPKEHYVGEDGAREEWVVKGKEADDLAGYFQRQAEAACLLGEVLQLTREESGLSPDVLDGKLLGLDAELQKGLLVAFAEIKGNWEPSCSTIAMLLRYCSPYSLGLFNPRLEADSYSAIIELHQKRLSLVAGSCRPEHMQRRQSAVLALRMACNVLRDIEEGSDHNEALIKNLPLAAVLCGILMLGVVGLLDLGPDERAELVRMLTDGLDRCVPRWGIASIT